MPKIAFIGAGSLGFTRGLVRDLLTFPELADSTIALMDVDRERLEFAEIAVKRIVAAGQYPAKVRATMNRRTALKDADAVLCTILAGRVNVWKHDILIPKQYGVDTCVGDTRGPSGIFRALRTVPVMLGICRDMERVCPDATLLNYTNPMAMLCRAMQGETSVKSTGLCHSVQGTARMLANWIGAKMEDVTYVCGGLNHMAWYLQYEVQGKDAYPRIRRAVAKPEIYRKEKVRNELFKALGYYPTESSGHHSEYNPWFRKRPDLIKKYCAPHKYSDWNPGEYAYILKAYADKEKTWKRETRQWLASDEVIDLKRGHEYAASIINALHGDHAPFEFNGNVRNFHYIDNLPYGCCVEIPIYVDKGGLHPIRVGPLPASVAMLTGLTAQIEELAVHGAIHGDPTAVYQAVAHDPLTSAVLSLAEIKKMVGEMFKASKAWLPQFKRFT